MPVTATSKFSTVVGLGKETTPGTLVAPTVFVPVTDAKPEDVRNYVEDQAMRGSDVQVYNEVPTQGWSTYEFDGPVYLSNIGVSLKSVYGAEDFSGSGPYVHKFGPLNTGTYQPPTYTITDFNGYNARAFPYGVCSQVAFTYSPDALLTYTSTWSAFPSSVTTTPTTAYDTKTVNAAYLGALKIGGTSAVDIESGTLTIAQNVDPITAINGLNTPASLFASGQTVTGQFTAIYAANAETAYLQAMIAGSQTTFEATFTNGADILDFKSSKVIFKKAPISRGKNYVEITVDFDCVANTTDATTAGGGYSPMAVTLTNTTNAAY